MVEAFVSFVLGRLGGLLLEKNTFFRNVHHGQFKNTFLRDVHGQFERLQNELESIIGFLKTADSKHNQNLDIRDWVDDVRDIAYDVEDVINAFLLKVASKEGEGSNNIGKDINNIFAKIEEISNRRKGYGVTSVVRMEGTISSSSSEMLLRRVYPHTKDVDTVGLDDQTNTLVAELLKEEDHLCVVCIHGMGGCGKSTLAKKVYNHPDVKRHFDCYAWTSITQKMNIVAIMQEILRKVSTLTSKYMANMKEVELFKKLSEILQTNCYLVVLDDIWSKEAWNALKPAFPNNKGSKVMFTTRNLEVAKHADRWSFNLEPRSLTYEEAWVLLCRKAFPPNVSSSLSCDFEECGRNIVKKCGGFPLQIIVLGGILATKGTTEEWEAVSKQIGSHTGHVQGDEIFSILSLSYNELSYNLKLLFLYLGLFPEDFLIPVKKLVRMWMAESLIMQEKEGETIEEVGTRYLNELIHRSMVQIDEKSMGGKKIKTCRLHDKMRELCIAIGREELFFEEININGNSSSSSSSSCLRRTSKKLQRCAIYFEREDEQFDFPKEFTQSVHTVFFIQIGRFFHQGFILKDFKLLKVLEFRGKINLQNEFEFDRVLGMLSNLRYLCISKYPGQRYSFTYINISVESFKNLVFLQTLDLRGLSMGKDRCIINKIPYVMYQLMHLYGDRIKLSNVNTMTKLQTLSIAWAGPWIADIVKLTNLEKLGIEGLDEKTMRLLTIAIGGGGLDKVRSLYLRYRCDDGVGQGDLSSDLLEALSAKSHLQKLNLLGRIKKLPTKFPSNLIKLNLKYANLFQDPMPILGKLQHLLFLGLEESYSGKNMLCCSNGFPKLQDLRLGWLVLEMWIVVEGALPCLTTCEIDFCKNLKMVPQGFKFLTKLQELKFIQMSKSFEQRVKEGGKDWKTIKHVPSVIVV